MLNRVVLVGRLTRDPDLRYTSSGVAVANFTLAVNRPFTNQEGNRDADFINCVVWRKPAENLANYMKKGNMVGVDGRLQSRTYEDQDGKTVFVVEVVADSIQFLESRNKQDDNQTQQQHNRQPSQQTTTTAAQEDPFVDEGQPIDVSDLSVIRMKRAAKKHFTVMELAYISKFYEYDGPSKIGLSVDRHPIAIRNIVNQMKIEGTFEKYQKIWDMQFRG